MRGMRAAVVMALTVACVLNPLGVAAQSKVVRVGYLAADLAANPTFPAAFREGLRDLGYVEGQNVVIEYRSAEGHSERLSSLAAEQATTTIPVVFAASADALGSGLVASLARPGGNVTGLSFLGPETVAKCLQLLKEAVPSVTPAAVLSHPGNPSEATRKIILKETEAAARALALHLQFLEARGPEEFERTFAEMGRGRAGG
jgi:ABC transporter substrate binding protein